MEINFLSESGRPGFELFPNSATDEGILKQLCDWQNEFPRDVFMIRNSSWSEGKCLRLSVGFQKPNDLEEEYIKSVEARAKELGI